MKNKIIAIIMIITGTISILIGSISLFVGKNNNNMSTKDSSTNIEETAKVFSLYKVTYIIDEKNDCYRAGEGYGNHYDDSTKFRKIAKNVKSATTANLDDIILKNNGDVYKIDSNSDEPELLMSNVENIVPDKFGDYALFINKSNELYIYGSVPGYYKAFYYESPNTSDIDGDDFGLTNEEHEQVLKTPVKIMDNVKTVKTDGTIIAIINTKDELYTIGATSDQNLDPYGKAYKIADNVKTVELENIDNASYHGCVELIDYITKDNKLYAYGCKRNFDIKADQSYQESQFIREDVDDIKIVNMGLGTWIKDTKNNLYITGGTLGGGEDSIYITDFKKILSNVDKIYDGYAITKNKDLYVAGYNSTGRFCTGDNKTVYTIKKVDSNVNFIEEPGGFIIKEDGVYICGIDDDGKFGFDIGTKMFTPTKLKIK